MMKWGLSAALVVLAVVAAAGRGKKHRHQKPGRDVLDRLASTTISEVQVKNEPREAAPAPLDVAPYSAVAASATCGDAGVEEFCRDTPGKRGIVCDVCEGIEGSSSRRHPAAFAVDGHPDTWWQSPTAAAGEQYTHVELVATLPAEMDLLHVIIKSGPSPRPLAWSLEVSSDGDDEWRLVKAFGDKEHCKRLWDLRPERRRRKARAARPSRADKPTCSTQFTSPRPLENGEMHVGLGEGVPTRRVRVSFRAAHEAAPAHQYYTVRALTLAARCRCHGRAQHCLVDALGATCSCTAGSCGAHCERCCGEGAGCARAESPACERLGSGLLCVNCTENRAGPLCDRCLFGYYSKTPDGPCLLCKCDPVGSEGSCMWTKRNGVTCKCNPGYIGRLCETCENPSAVHPDCRIPETTPACKCDPRGVADPNRICDEVCECKEHVIGERCDTCAAGHYGLSGALAAGCRACHCSRLSAACDSNPDPGPDMILPLGDVWLVSDAQMNETQEASVDNQGKPYVTSYEIEGWESFYWLTEWWSGTQLSWYGGEIHANMFWGVVRGDSGGSPTIGPDAILIAADGTMIAFSNKSYEEPGELNLVVPIKEGGWYTVNDQPPEMINKNQLMDVLADLKGLMLRAYFHLDQDEVHLESVECVGAGAFVREICACPGGYAGRWCESCAWGHVRVPLAPRVLGVPTHQCVPCDCNGHATCDTVEGVCGPCLHNTSGAHCERCLPGHYGNPVQGACRPCACPLYESSNNFSPNCALASAEGDEYVCTQCPDGYAGDHCEMCEFGYWGSPGAVGGSCRPCECGGAPCRRDTGVCLACPAHAEGARCDVCQEGYWFGPAGEDSGAGGGVAGTEGATCVPCACGAGALAGACDARSGQCACRQGWAGRACDTCAPGYGDVSAGCPACRCGLGAQPGGCEAHGGECSCAPGAAPPRCDTCAAQHYNLTRNGCSGCNCSSVGAEGNACDIRSGQCRCRAHATGRACDTCEEGYWGLREGGCRRCECGAGAAACDPATGACACAPGVTGDNCDACLPGYYGFGPAGCLPCPRCTDGKVCSPVSGRCSCPTHARGPQCRDCAPGYWASTAGCVQCDCGPGALTNTCDPHTGQCKCRTGWSGLSCDACTPGNYGSRCKTCNCVVAGTSGCQDGFCSCDEYGRCPCKVNVIGEKCSQCRPGTFGLSGENPSGCTECFCFGRAAHCSQAGLTRAALRAPAPVHLTLLHSPTPTLVDQDSLLSIHTHALDATISMPWPPVPVYVELDKRFLGDRTTSYGGWLIFTVEEEGGEDLSEETRLKFPLVRLYGKDIVLEYYQRIPAMNGTHSVRFHESLWSVRSMVGAVSRGALMFALRKLDRVMLRVSTRTPLRDDPVHALLLNVSLDTTIPSISRTEPALGVEVCDCSLGYAAPSCQEPALGFWMPPQQVHVTSVAGTITIQLEGDAAPCYCNGRAVACDPTTGHCLNCTGGTSGARCDKCEAGHYGAPDSPGGCQPCPCPSRARNFADACVLTNGRVQCLCKPGYTGSECSRCASGWYRATGAAGECVRCACHAAGALGSRCDARGRCRCRPHAAGDKCDRCASSRTVMDDHGCTACDNCSQILLDSVEALQADMRRRADVSELNRIPQPFPVLREYSHNTSVLYSHLKKAETDLQLFRTFEDHVSMLERKEHGLFTEANRIKTEANTKEKEALYLSLEGMSSLEEALKYRRILGEKVEDLNEFAQGERHLSAHRAIKEAKHILRQINNIQLGDFLMAANDASTSANLQSTAMEEYNFRIEDAYHRVRGLQRALQEWSDKSEDWSRVAAQSQGAGDAAEAGVRGARARLAAVRDAALRCRLLAQDISSVTAHNITHDIITSIDRARNLSRDLPKLEAEVTDLIQATEEKEGIYYNLTPVYRQKYLHAVEKHVSKLGKKAQEYKRLFADTRASAASGVAAARAWADIADAVRDAAAAASAALQTAAVASKLAGGPAVLRDIAMKAKNHSVALTRDGTAVLKKAEELKNQLEHLRRNADLVSVVLRGLGWQERDLGLRPRADVASTLATASEQADRVFTTTRVLYDEASEVRRRVTYDLRRQLAELQRHGDTALGAAQEHVSQIRGNTERGAEVAEALAAAAAARARDHDVAGAALRPSLEALKEKIARARHAADSVSVSVTSPAGAGCARAYALSVTSPSVTRLALELSFADTVRDGPLLYLEDDIQEPKRYMKLVVENKKLSLVWDLGAAEGVITHPEELQPNVDDQHNTYRLEIDRVWNSVRLVVEGSGGARVEARNSSGEGGGAVQLRARRVWLGAPGAVLPACVHALSTDDARIGLWNFDHQPPEAKCSGCTQRGVSGSGALGSLARFGGAGYSELRRAGGAARRADRTQFAVSFTVRTRDSDALLFMALDQVNNRSVVVRMRQCRVVFEVEYGGARLGIAARGEHCRGRPVHVQAIRVFAHNNLEKGSLRVNGEETLGSPSPPVQAVQALPELSGARYWVGGVPPGAPRAVPALLGCLGALVVNREAYDPLDTPARHGVEPLCVDKTLRSAMFSGVDGGHVELPWPGLRRTGALGLSLRALAPAGLLLLRAPHAHANDVDDDEHNHYLMLELIEGDFQLTAAAGKAELRLRTNGTKYDDKHLHTLRIIRDHKQLELWVDEEKVSSGVLAGNAIPIRPRGLFLGGAPPGAAPAGRPLAPSFTGTITDLIIDATLVGMETAVNWSGAQLGRAHSAPRAAPRAAPRQPHTHRSDAECAKGGSYTVEGGAVKFGDAAHSRAALRLGARARAHLALRLHFRTYRDGLLLLAPGSKTKPKHFLALLIKEGKLKLILRGRKRKEVTLPTFVADGTWRSASVRVSRGRAVLGSGGAAGSARAPPLSRGSTLYIGGLPPPPALPNIPPSVVRLGGLVGCVRRVELGARAQDLVRAHHAVGQCFPNVQPAAYFGGDAYATYSSVWTSVIGDTEAGIEIEMEFRTYEPNGVLLQYRGTLLEVKEGQVVLSWEGGSVSAGSACDGLWHAVRVRGPPAASLRVDAAPPVRAPASLLPALPAPSTTAPLYLAGLPETITDSLEGKENFKGCIKEVVVNGQKKEWKEMESLHNVLLDSCPSP